MASLAWVYRRVALINDVWSEAKPKELAKSVLSIHVAMKINVLRSTEGHD